MADFFTSNNRLVSHCHIPDYPCEEREFTAEEKQIARDWLSLNYPNAVEIRVPSQKYNCHGYAFTGAHGWFNYPRRFVEDDFFEVPFAEAKRGDLIIYRNDAENLPFSHSAIVRRVFEGRIEKVRSKWAVYAAVVHDLNDVPSAYGRAARCLRRNGAQPA